MRNLSKACSISVSLTFVSLCPALHHPAIAQVIPDSTLGTEASVVIPISDSSKQIQAGATRGTAVFHSFEAFSLDTGQSVYFSHPQGISNILSRVTGASSSRIDGTLGVNGTANLFLLNPNGIVLGPNAELNVSGAFVGTTASELRFDHDFSFSAVNPASVPLLQIAVNPGLQDGIPMSPITHRGMLTAGRSLQLTGTQLDLQGQLRAGEDLILQASDSVQIRDTALKAFVAEAEGDLVVQGDRQVDILALNHADSGLFSGKAMVLRSANPVMGDAHYYSGGKFRVEQLDRSLGSLISPQDPVIFSGSDVQLANYEGASLHILAAGSVELGQVTITNPDSMGESINPNTTPTLANLQLSDGTPLTINGNAQPTLDVRAGVNPEKLAGLIQENDVNATHADISVENITIVAPNSLVFLSSQYAPNSSLTGGSITIHPQGQSATSSGIQAETVILNARQDINLINSLIDVSSSNQLGKIHLHAGATVRMDGLLGSPTGLLAVVNQGMPTPHQSIEVKANNLEVVNGATILSSTQGTQNAGDILLQADNRFLADASSPAGVLNPVSPILLGSSTLIWSLVQPFASGAGGDIQIFADQLDVTRGGLIHNITIGEGDAGAINVDVVGNIQLDGVSASTQVGGGIYSGVFPGGRGRGGDITVSAQNLSMTNGAVINPNNIFGFGDTGNIELQIAEDIVVSGIAPVSGFGSGAQTSIVNNSQGNAGDIFIAAKNLIAGEGASISSTIFGTGNAGNVTLEIAEDIIFDGSNPKGKSDNTLVGDSGELLFSAISSAVEPSGQGNAGELRINARNVDFSNGALISVSQRGVGNAGNLFLEVEETARFSGIDTLTDDLSEGQFFTSGIYSTLRGIGQGGNITVVAKDLEMTEGARISAATFGNGDAGNITLDIQDSVLLDGGSVTNPLIPTTGINISVERSGFGSAGTLNLNTEELLITNEATLTASNLGEGTTGGIIVNAERIFLDQGGNILATSRLGNGGNVLIGQNRSDGLTSTAPIIVLGQDSQISAIAGDNQNPGDGGNINIRAPFIISFPQQNADIIANAFDGTGGNITLTTDAIFNLTVNNTSEVNPLRQNRTNDISASSQLGQSGTLNLSGLEIDPSQGLTELPTAVIDESEAIAQRCQGSNQIATNALYLTGRSGIPIRPRTEKASEFQTHSIRTLASLAASSNVNPHRRFTPLQEPLPQEAMTWQYQANGTVKLLAGSAIATLSPHC